MAMAASVTEHLGQLRLPRVPALPHVAAATVRRLLVGVCLASGVALITRPGWGLLVAGVLLWGGR